MAENYSPAKKYNILMLAPTMFFADYGCHVRILEEALILRKLGHTVTILTYPNGRNIWDIPIERSWGLPRNYRIEVGSSRHKIYLDALLFIKTLFYSLKHKPDIIHGHLHEGGLMGWVLGKILRVPLVFDFQGSLTGEMLDHNFIENKSRWLTFMRWLETKIDHMANAVLTSSKHSARLLHNNFGVPKGRIHPTPDCVNAEAFNPALFDDASKASLKTQLGIPADKKLLVYAGLLTEYQGVGLMLHALAELSKTRNDFHLLLMGFPSISYYRNLTRELGISELVTFTGKMPYENLAAHLALGDAAIAPKLSATEGNGKILNYISMALPTVAFKTPVSKEYLGSYGIYAEEKTAPALANAIDAVLALSDDKRAKLGALLRRHAGTHFSWEDVGHQIEDVYEAVLDGHPAPATMARKKLALKSAQIHH